MTSKEIIDSVPDDAPSSTAKPKNNLWTWIVGAFACVISVLYLRGEMNHNREIRDVKASKDATIELLKNANGQLRDDNKALQTDLSQCNADKLRINDSRTDQLLEYLELKPGKKQTISISPKAQSHE